MKLLRITQPDSTYEKARECYSQSFPIHEQRTEESQKSILAEPEYHFDAVTDGEFVGAVLYWQWADYIYVEHLFISPEYRGEGIGSRVLDILCRKGRNVILEIDPPVNETALRRMKFYMRNGFRENEYRHVHPPYRDGSSGHELVVMSFPGKLTEKQYGDFNEYLKNTVMAK